ncbi:MAG: hypothetical protein IJE84_03690 [Clostridia bacterium]|nr:hypothetical protein [Clostridia bacterium]
MKYAVISSKAPKNCIEALKQHGYTPLLLPPFERLSEPVNTHADMLFFSYNNIIITHRDYYKKAHGIFDTLCSERGLSLVLSDDDIGSAYPQDVALNAIMLGGILYSNTPYTSKEVLRLCRKTVHVKQGYTACSTLALSDNCVITADSSLFREYKKSGIDARLISNGSISLPPYDCGFIGGASGVDGDTVYFCGDIDSHRDATVIKNVVRSVGMKYISLSDERLYDVGGIKFF